MFAARTPMVWRLNDFAGDRGGRFQRLKDDTESFGQRKQLLLLVRRRIGVEFKPKANTLEAISDIFL